jgi:D-alanyl-D-alanine carboxypeptidase
VSTYGSEEEALRYVSTPDKSAHVTGDAVDIGPTNAHSWLSR